VVEIFEAGCVGIIAMFVLKGIFLFLRMMVRDLLGIKPPVVGV
jgi:hypothetical protein